MGLYPVDVLLLVLDPSRSLVTSDIFLGLGDLSGHVQLYLMILRELLDYITILMTPVHIRFTLMTAALRQRLYTAKNQSKYLAQRELWVQ